MLMYVYRPLEFYNGSSQENMPYEIIVILKQLDQLRYK